MEDLYRISLLGTLKEGVDPKEASGDLSRYFKIPPGKLETCFDGKKRAVKHGISLDQARKY